MHDIPLSPNLVQMVTIGKASSADFIPVVVRKNYLPNTHTYQKNFSVCAWRNILSKLLDSLICSP